jgi:hypothetical protein
MIRCISEDGSDLIFRVKQSKKIGLVTIYHTTWLNIPEDLIHNSTIVRMSDLN